MKHLFVICLFFAMPSVRAANIAALLGGYVASGPSYLLEENCEGAGTPTSPITWTDSGAVEWDYTSTILQGAQSVRAETGESSSANISAISDVWVYFLFRPTLLPTGSAEFFRLDTANTLSFRLNATGNVIIRNAALTASTPTVTAMAAGTTYHVWIHFVANGTSTVAFSTDGVRPTTGNNFTSVASSSDTISRVVIAPNRTAIFDRILVDDVTIGDTP